MKTGVRIAMIAAVVAGLSAATGAQQAPPSQGRGMGMMGRHDAASMTQMRDIHDLLLNHESITRTVTNLPDGIRTVTASDDPRLAQVIKDHVTKMQERVGAGDDPGWPMESQALHAIFQYHDKIQTSTETTATGVVVTQRSSDPGAVAALQKHAADVTDLVREGMAAMHRAMMNNRGGMMGHGMRGSPGVTGDAATPR